MIGFDVNPGKIDALEQGTSYIDAVSQEALAECQVIVICVPTPLTKPFYPGPGLGGHCIPIDPFYLTWKAREYGHSTWLIELAGEINVQMPTYVFGRLREVLDRVTKA